MLKIGVWAPTKECDRRIGGGKGGRILAEFEQRLGSGHPLEKHVNIGHAVERIPFRVGHDEVLTPRRPKSTDLVL